MWHEPQPHPRQGLTQAAAREGRARAIGPDSPLARSLADCAVRRRRVRCRARWPCGRPPGPLPALSQIPALHRAGPAGVPLWRAPRDLAVPLDAGASASRPGSDGAHLTACGRRGRCPLFDGSPPGRSPSVARRSSASGHRVAVLLASARRRLGRRRSAAPTGSPARVRRRPEVESLAPLLACRRTRPSSRLAPAMRAPTCLRGLLARPRSRRPALRRARGRRGAWPTPDAEHLGPRPPRPTSSSSSPPTPSTRWSATAWRRRHTRTCPSSLHGGRGGRRTARACRGRAAACAAWTCTRADLDPAWPALLGQLTRPRSGRAPEASAARPRWWRSRPPGWPRGGPGDPRRAAAAARAFARGGAAAAAGGTAAVGRAPRRAACAATRDTVRRPARVGVAATGEQWPGDRPPPQCRRPHGPARQPARWASPVARRWGSASGSAASPPRPSPPSCRPARPSSCSRCSASSRAGR